MKVFNRSIKVILVLSIMLLSLIGCDRFGGIEPVPQEKVIRKSSDLTFLKPTSARFNKVFNVSRLVTVNDGGIISTGDDTCGFSELIFEPGDLRQDTTISFGWDSQGYFTDLAPHGIVFDNPVDIKLSYKDADLSGVNEEDLRIWYYRESDDTWELIGGYVNLTEKRVEGSIYHFSRYAIGAE